MKMSTRTYLSSRGIPLVYYGEPFNDAPILTVENYCKWYTLWLIMPDGTVKELEFPDDPPGFNDIPYMDHAPNPRLIQLFAREKDYCLCDQSFEMMIGRWELEYKRGYILEEKE